MEHPCPKCGTPVEDGTPFCRHCRAPQIRVAIEKAIEPPRTPVKQADSSDFIPAPAVSTRPASAFLSQKIDWSHGLPCAAMGGFLALLLFFIPLFQFGPAFLGAGAFAVYLYYRRTHTGLKRGTAARLGAASGAFAFLFLSVVIVATVVYMPDNKRAAIVAQMREATMAQLKATQYDPDTVRWMTEVVNTREWVVAGIIFSLLVFLLICTVGASIGGAWYSAWLQKRNRG